MWVTHYTYPDREPIKCWEPAMPRVPDFVLNCAIYLYQSEEGAQEGEPFGGTGFLLSVPSKHGSPFVHVYAITNRHVVEDVIEDGGVVRVAARVVRVNRLDGTTTILDLPTGWVPHPEGDDLTVHPIPVEPRQRRGITAIEVDYLALPQDVWVKTGA